MPAIGTQRLGAPRSTARRSAAGLPAEQLERELLDDVERLLGRWQLELAGKPEAERARLLLLALEREQIVAVAYREEAVAGRVAQLDVGPEVRRLIRQTLVWIWKDEQLHAEYLRGELLRARGAAAAVVVYGRALQGALSGWTTATSNHRDARTAPLRVGAAGVLVALAAAAGKVPPVLRRELHFQGFRRYCELNVALEASAELAYRRLVEVSPDAEERATIERIRDDEGRHAAAFRVLAGSLDEQDDLLQDVTLADLVRRLGEISPWFVPASLRPQPGGPGAAANRAPPSGPMPDVPPRHGVVPRHGFASRQSVVVRSGSVDGEKLDVLEEVLDRAGLGRLAAGSATAAIRACFMLGYDRRDRSNVNDPELIEGLARYLRRHGVADVAVLESPTVYANAYLHRSVEEVAAYFGFGSPAYRIVDMSADLRPLSYERGFVEHAISATWLDAELRIVVPKLRTAPTDFAHLSLNSLEGSTGAIDATVYSKRQVDYRSAIMMLLDVAPPDFSLLDAWAPVADGTFGVMGCDRPAQIRHLYAGPDALSVDEIVLADLGVGDPRRAPIVRLAYHWFGLTPGRAAVDGARPDLHEELRGAHASRLSRALGLLSDPVYVYLSRNGVVFVPAIDTTAFPPRRPVGTAVRLVQEATQRTFGLRAPRNGSGAR
ncbi:MAG TPA: hypothetical protein VMD59_19240 [Acidimicrobiales bacterium]|nr:hypothetical protein [Acidimicrobiales bacterium]